MDSKAGGVLSVCEFGKGLARLPTEREATETHLQDNTVALSYTENFLQQLFISVCVHFETQFDLWESNRHSFIDTQGSSGAK